MSTGPKADVTWRFIEHAIARGHRIRPDALAKLFTEAGWAPPPVVSQIAAWLQRHQAGLERRRSGRRGGPGGARALSEGDAWFEWFAVRLFEFYYGVAKGETSAGPDEDQGYYDALAREIAKATTNGLEPKERALAYTVDELGRLYDKHITPGTLDAMVERDEAARKR